MALRAIGQQEGGLVPHLEEVGGLLGELFRVAEYEPGMAGQDLDPVRGTDQGLGIAEHDDAGRVRASGDLVVAEREGTQRAQQDG